MNNELHILLVDDNPLDRGIVKRELRQEFGELHFHEVTNANELSAAISGDEFDLVITDFQIRWTNGLDVLRHVKLQHPTCPVLMFTATGSEEIAVEAMKSGLSDYVIKNSQHMVRLSGAVRNALENAAVVRRAAYLETRLQNLLTQLQIGAFSCSLDGLFTDANDAMLELLGCKSASDLPGRSLREFFPSQVDSGTFLKKIAAANTSEETTVEFNLDPGALRVLRINGRRIHVAGEPPRIDGLVEDVTIRSLAETRARQAEIAQTQIEMLSDREKQILIEVAAGGMNKTIARKFDISTKTVERHRSNLMKKLRVRSLAELVRLAALAENFSQQLSVPQEHPL